jgi:hypothetical protein
VARHESRFVTDAEAIFSFIDEVTRAEEMRSAVKLGSDYPTGNWVHVFDSFEEVVSTLRTALGSSGNLRRRALDACLKHEILRNLQGVIGGAPNRLSIDEYFASLATAKGVGRLDDLNGTTLLRASQVNSLALGLTVAYTAYETTFLDEALRSGEYLAYDSAKARFDVGPIQERLINLRGAIEVLRDGGLASGPRERFLTEYASQGDGARLVPVKNLHLLPVVLAYHTYERAARLSVAAFRALSAVAVSPEPRWEVPSYLSGIPTTAVPSVQEVENWIEKSTDLP